jgi:hypothetical protein
VSWSCAVFFSHSFELGERNKSAKTRFEGADIIIIEHIPFLSPVDNKTLQ